MFQLEKWEEKRAWLPRNLLYRTRSRKIFNESKAPFSTNNNSHFDTMTSIPYRNCIKFHDFKCSEREKMRQTEAYWITFNRQFFFFDYSPSFTGTWWWLLLFIYLCAFHFESHSVFASTAACQTVKFSRNRLSYWSVERIRSGHHTSFEMANDLYYCKNYCILWKDLFARRIYISY